MKRYRFYLSVLIIVIVSIFAVGCSEQISHTQIDSKNNMLVHFLDVGQGDSTFIEFPNGQTSLIDAGTRSAGSKVVDYIQGLGITKIDYIIATHPHEDHIGGMPEVIKNFDIGYIYMPDKTANTLIFEELLLEINNKDLKINLGKGGETIIDEEALKYKILAPNSDAYSNTNDFSIVTKIQYGYNSIIITGDAEKQSENDILKTGYDLSADILRIGHHGGKTSSGMEFLNAVDPKHSVISVREGNSHGHPHKETLDRLNKIDSKIKRTDELGDIIAISDGEKIDWMEDPIVEKVTKIVYIGNKNTKVFHINSCNSLPNSENQVKFKSIQEAENGGYRPHKLCVE